MDDEVRQQILQRTLQEVDEESAIANPCVICLDKITEPCVAQPCHHANFDFLCLVSWLEQQPTCPLCKSELTAVEYELEAPEGPKLYKVPPRIAKPPTPAAPRSRPGPRHGPRGGRNFPQPSRPQLDDPLERRRNVYRNQTYSMRVGTNRLSQYRELTPELFNRDEELVSRARKWIRRELKVFSFLNPETEEQERTPQQQVSRPGHQRLENRRANNAEFLLEYVIAILRTVDLKGSAGQSEELLRDFIGRENARLFIHELQAWLRSPYMSLEDWDRHVQYSNTARATSDTGRGEPHQLDRTWRSASNRGRAQSFRRRPYRSRSQEALDRSRRLQHAQQRYHPY
ncbi:uncharacterized protein N7511_004562 [Penicillium nucicola]|uniref:uncharacterized protein n=1 Tax=Penicillium nucicola TaxID=1850975 RepID=UPI0025451B23|nr:uncharacterized protein N7511_004562 [Penicillium nucicola]KAJ5766946.1 hypothetical protein N7511_004562 [Penicillium nucicola]